MSVIQLRLEAIAISPHGLCVVENVFGREPEALRFALAVELRLIVVIGGRGMLRFAVRQQAPDLLRIAFHNDQQIAPSVVAINLSIVLLRALIGVENVVEPGSPKRKFPAAHTTLISPQRTSGLPYFFAMCATAFCKAFNAIFCSA